MSRMVISKECQSALVNTPIAESYFEDSGFEEFENPNVTLDNSRRGLLKRKPNIRILDDRLFIDNLCISFKGKRKMYQLVKIFALNPGKNFSKDDLISMVYGDLVNENKSVRFILTLNHNIVKLVSRTRCFIMEHNLDRHVGIYWFPYDPLSQSWRFLRVDRRFSLAS